MKDVKLFLPAYVINEVTRYYVDLIDRSLKTQGSLVSRIVSIREVCKRDTVLTITPDTAFNVLFLRNVRLIHWFQGIGPEEYIILHKNDRHPLLLKIIVKTLEIRERFIIMRSKAFIFVSESMKEHYEQKYKIPIKNYAIVPCYNSSLRDFFSGDRYIEPSFIYAGSIHGWQCIEKTLDIFKEVQHLLPDARLALMTKNISEMSALVQERGLKNVAISYAPQNELEKIMSEYKYAFLIRDNSIVNKVSTPTKMSSYLSAGLMPIYTDSIDAFESNIDLHEYAVKANSAAMPREIALLIYEHHLASKFPLKDKGMQKVYEKVFSSFYSDFQNVSKLVELFNAVL